MIRLDVKDYCQSCTDFKPLKEITDINDGYYFTGTNTVITCKYEKRCMAIYDKARKELRTVKE